MNESSKAILDMVDLPTLHQPVAPNCYVSFESCNMMHPEGKGLEKAILDHIHCKDQVGCSMSPLTFYGE